MCKKSQFNSDWASDNINCDYVSNNSNNSIKLYTFYIHLHKIRKASFYSLSANSVFFSKINYNYVFIFVVSYMVKEADTQRCDVTGWIVKDTNFYYPKDLNPLLYELLVYGFKHFSINSWFYYFYNFSSIHFTESFYF